MKSKHQLGDFCRISLIREASCITRQTQIHASVKQISGVYNKEVVATSRLSHLTIHNFLQNFCSTFFYPLPWSLCLLTCATRRRMRTMPHTWLSPKAYPLRRSTKSPRTCGNRTASVDQLKYHLTFMVLRTPFHSFKYSLTRYT